MFECLGLKLGDGGRVCVCERTNLLFIEFNTVSCSSRSTMEAGPWTGKSYSAPWMYHRVAGQYTLFEKQVVSDVSPGPRRPGPRALQDSTNWRDGRPPPPGAPPRQARPCFSGQECKRAAASPKPHRQRRPTDDGSRAACTGQLARGAAHTPEAAAAAGERAAAAGRRGPPGAPCQPRGQLQLQPQARPPPSYEAHMRLRAGQSPRHGTRPRPPPYLAPPPYEAAHRTARPRPRARRAAGGERPAGPGEAWGPPTPRSGRQGPPGQAAAPGRWSHPAGASTWGGRRRRAERGEPPGRPCSPPPRSHTLPRAARRTPDGSVPRHALPARGRSPQGRAGGLLLIDATRVAIRTRYVPPGRPERAPHADPPAAPAAPPPAGLQARAPRLPPGPPWSALRRTPSGPARPGRRAEGAAGGQAPGLAGPERGPSRPPAAPAPESRLEGPPRPQLARPTAGRRGDGCGARPDAAPCGDPPHGAYALQLREAVRRIRRHTAPDSDTDEELEKERRPAGSPFPGRAGRLAGSSSSSSSSVESVGSHATVVPADASSATLSNGPERGWQLSQAAPWQ
uniref:dendrin n=1 Tax=Euleptes europaea TaxID=460621 RepID=UPI002541CB9E|nr:dendrin [Euleptes europaea]